MPKIPRSLSWGAGRVVWKMSTIKIAFKWYIMQPATVGRVMCSQTKRLKEHKLRTLPSIPVGAHRAVPPLWALLGIGRHQIERVPENKSQPQSKCLLFLGNSHLKLAKSTTSVKWCIVYIRLSIHLSLHSSTRLFTTSWRHHPLQSSLLGPLPVSSSEIDMTLPDALGTTGVPAWLEVSSRTSWAWAVHIHSLSGKKRLKGVMLRKQESGIPSLPGKRNKSFS